MIFREEKRKYFSSSSNKVSWPKKLPQIFSPIQYTFTCVTQSSCLLQQQGCLGENTQQQIRPLGTQYHRNLSKK